MKILVIGSGGREHALAWKLAQSDRVSKVFVAPGNGGTAMENKLENISISGTDLLADFAKQNDIALTVVGPEAPLADGIVNTFRAQGLKIFGPTKEAAQLESSKDFAKAFMKRHNIPTADYQTFTHLEQAHQYIDKKGVPIVIKADGLAAGKGVIVATSLKQAHDAIDMMLSSNKFGNAGSRVVIEDFLEGEEASFIVLVDGKNILPLATSQDHKRLKNNDEGPNTGGMGAYSPAPIVTPALHTKILNEIIVPTVEGMRHEGHPFTGFLYAGLMIDKNGNPKTLEFNCRMGDPETQPIMFRLKSDLTTILEHGVNGTLDQIKLDWDQRVALGIVMAATGYPDNPKRGDMITGIPEASEDGKVFHAGTKIDPNKHLLTSGGRVLCAVGLADTIRAAQKRAYSLVQAIQFEGAQFRTDIGWRALKS